MKKFTKKLISLMSALLLIVSAPLSAMAADKATLDKAVNETAAYMLKTINNPQVGSIGGEWAVLGLARSGYKVPDAYYQKYYKNVEKYVKEKKGILHDKKYTEYSRLILGLTAAGFDPSKVAGYNLTTALGDFDKTVWQGINGPIFALIALDSKDYAMPKNASAKVQATRDRYIAEILALQLPDGGFSLTANKTKESKAKEKADADITAMAIQALAKYQDKANVKKATDLAVSCLSKMQNKSGGYSSWGVENVESTAQVIVALTELGIPLQDARFVKNGKSTLDHLLTFKQKDGSFKHTLTGTGNNQMATEQAFYALVAAQRAQDKKTSLYRMNEEVNLTTKKAA